MKFEPVEILIRKAINSFGLDIKRLKKTDSEHGRIVKMLNSNNIDLVIDIGANNGQYAKSLRLHGYNKRIISFEPLSDAWQVISLSSHSDPNWDVYRRCAVGRKITTSSINVSKNSVSSSLLEMLDSHKSAAPYSEFISTEQVDIITLDSIYDELNLAKYNFFVKIDTQGFEDEVISGGSTTFKNARGLQIELSIVPLYSGQKLFSELLDILKHIGFEVWSFFPGFTDNTNAKMLQVDAVLFKKL